MSVKSPALALLDSSIDEIIGDAYIRGTRKQDDSKIDALEKKLYSLFEFVYREITLTPQSSEIPAGIYSKDQLRAIQGRMDVFLPELIELLPEESPVYEALIALYKATNCDAGSKIIKSKRHSDAVQTESVQVALSQEEDSLAKSNAAEANDAQTLEIHLRANSKPESKEPLELEIPAGYGVKGPEVNE